MGTNSDDVEFFPSIHEVRVSASCSLGQQYSLFIFFVTMDSQSPQSIHMQA